MSVKRSFQLLGLVTLFAAIGMSLEACSQADAQTISWSEFGREISLSYDSSLTARAEAQTIPELPVSDQILFSESHPAYAQIRFPEFQGGRTYQLPLLPVENNIAQVMIFRTADFPGYGDNLPLGFVNQQQMLMHLLETGMDPARCAQPNPGAAALPFLPWLNAQQTLCAQPTVLAFPGGKEVRYLTYYSQDPSPVLDQQVFYTFQGLTDDNQFYVSAVFPVETGVFPTEPPACPKCGEPDYNPFPAWQALLDEQLAQLNALPANEFKPSLKILDKLVQSIRITN